MSNIYISGIGTYIHKGYGIDTLWGNVQTSSIAVGIKSDWIDSRIVKIRFGKPEEVSLKEELQLTDVLPPMKYSYYGMLACKKALEDARLTNYPKQSSIGMVIDTAAGTSIAVEEYLNRLIYQGLHKTSPILFTRTVANTALGDISRLFKLRGPSSLLFNECSLCYGFDLLKKGMCDIVICGSIESFNEYYILSEKMLFGDGFGECFYLGEGAAFIVLESEKSLKKRIGKHYASIVDYSVSFDGENVHNSSIRSPAVLNRNIQNLKNHIKKEESICWSSACFSEAQVREYEMPIIKRTMSDKTVNLFRHKHLTGEMKSVSSILGVALLSKKMSEESISLGVANTYQEGGSNTLFLLKS